VKLLRQSLRVLFLTAIAWAGIVAATGGFQFHIGGVRVSSREPENELLAAFAAALGLIAAARLEGPGGLAAEWGWWRRAARHVVGWTRFHAHQIANAVPALVAIVVIGVQIHRWTAAPTLWLDEETIALVVRERSFTQLAGPVWLGATAPLGWLAAERTAILLFGTGELALRFVPALFGIATLAAAVGIGRRWMTPFGATILVVLCAFNQWLSHYWFEAKQYTADAFWALALPALAVWAIEADDDVTGVRRAAVWWMAATVGQFLANGAALVTPCCAIVLLAASASPRRLRGRTTAAAIAALGLMWVAGALLHYQLLMRYTLHSAYLYQFWDSHLPPPSIGLIAAVGWMFDRLEDLAGNPAGTALWVSLWVLAPIGFVVAVPRALGVVFATVPLSAFLLAGFRIVPLSDRLVLWMVPALAVGMALVMDRAARVALEAGSRRRLVPLAIAAVVAAGVVRVCVDVIARWQKDYAAESRTSSKQRMDDRTAVRWLMAQRQPGDAIVSTRLGWPAIWWYGDIPIGAEDVARGRLRDGGVMLEVKAETSAGDCDSGLRDALKGQRRVLVYVGFQDFHEPFGDLLFHRIEELGSAVAFHSFSDLSRAVVVDLRAASTRENTADRPAGCVGVQPAVRW